MKARRDKTPKIKMKERKKEILDLIAKGYSRRMVLDYLEEKYPEDKEWNRRYQYYESLKALKNIEPEFLEHIRNIQKERLEHIISNAVVGRDYIAATKAVEVMNKMFGVYETKQTVKIEDSTIKFEFGNVNNEEQTNE